MDLVSSVAHY